ncbi:hypothetical protein J4219_01855 [Candidatus Woesearchaeota archaeon]|nr:hypothetical protein [Candidatus Woesearchaeota archaeon]
MATPLDITVLKQFEGVFPFILVLVLTYVVLLRIEWFKEKNQVFAALIALILAMLTLFSDIAMKTINLMAPWIVLLIMFMTFVMFTYMVLGFEQKDIVAHIKSGEFASGTFVIALLILIAVGSLMFVVSEEYDLDAVKSGNVSGTGPAEFWQTIFHPKVLGLMLVMLIAFFTVRYMTEQ